MPCYRGNLLQSVRLCPFLVRWPFVPMDRHNFSGCAMSFRVTCWVFMILLLVYFFLFHFSLPVHHQLQSLSQLQQSPVPLQFPLPHVVIATDAMPHFWACFQDSGVPVSCCITLPTSMCKGHIALQELQAVSLMLHKMAFWLSCKVVALHLDSGTAKAFICNQSNTASPFLSRLACHILHMTDKCGFSLIPPYIPTHLNMGANYLSWGKLVPEWHLLPCID